MLNGEDDHFARWLQGICAIFLALFAILCGWYTLNHLIFVWIIGGATLSLGSVRLSWRCARYAITGKNNINRDDF